MDQYIENLIKTLENDIREIPSDHPMKRTILHHLEILKKEKQNFIDKIKK